MFRIRAAVLLSWLLLSVVALSLYVYWSEPLKRVAANLVPLAAAGCFVASFAGLGSIPTRYLARAHGRIIQFVTSVALGAGMTGMLVLILGVMGSLSRTILGLWTLSGIVAFVPAVHGWRKIRAESEYSGSGEWVAAGTLLLFLASCIPFVVAPELTTDALEYHLLVPRIYLSTGKIGMIPLLVESNYPSLAEYLYIPMLSLTESIVCKCFHYMAGILLLLLLGRMVRKISPDSNPYWAPALFVSMPVAAVQFGWAWNDLLYTLFVLLSLFYLLCYHEADPGERKDSDLLLAGISAGLGAWTKYTFVIFLVVLLAIGWVGVRRRQWSPVKLLFLFVPVGFFISLWAIKNWILTGNPVFPFLNEVFRSPYYTPEVYSYFKGTLTRYEFPDWGWKHQLLFPFYISLKARIMDVYTGVLPLVVAPFLFFRSSSPGARMLKLFAMLYVLVWLFVQTYVRSLLPLLAVIFVVASVPLHRLVRSQRSVRIAWQVLFCAAIAGNFFATILSTYYLFDPVKVFLGRETRAQYLTRNSRSQPAYDWLNARGDVQSVLLVGLHNPFYLREPFVFSGCCDPPVAEALTAGVSSAPELAAKLKRMGIGRIVIDFQEYAREHKDGLYSWPPEHRKIFEQFVTEHCVRRAVFGRDVVYELQ